MAAHYVSVGGKTYGPATPKELEKWYKAGTFSPTDFVWDETRGSWIEAIKFPATLEIFRDVSGSAAGLDSIDELSSAERGRFTDSSDKSLGRCVNHSEDAAAAVCPQCRRPFCLSCLKNVDGAGVCLDCIGSQKKKGAGGLRIYLPIAIAVLICVVVIGIIFVYATGGPPPQPDTLDRIEIRYRESRGDDEESPMAAPEESEATVSEPEE